MVKRFIVFFIFAFSFAAIPVLAADLNYSTATYILLTSPSVTLTIATSSTASSLVVNADNVVVGIGSGESMTLISASKDLTITGGTYTLTCSSGTAQVVLSAVATYTVTPTASACVTASTPAPSAPSGGGSAFINPPAQPIATTTIPAPNTPNPDPLAALYAQLEALIKELQARGIASPFSPPAAPALGFTFTRNLALGSAGADVNALQLFLIRKDVGAAAKALAKNGATRYFGPLTQKALAEYQNNENIRPAAGYFGPLTRAYINARY